MNLFAGLNSNQVLSSVLMIGLFTVYAGLVVVALWSFYVTSRPRGGGRIVRASAWHLGALFWFLWANVACVWSAPAENSLYDFATNKMFEWGYSRLTTVIWSLVFAAAGCLCLLIGWVSSRGEAARLRDSA